MPSVVVVAPKVAPEVAPTATDALIAACRDRLPEGVLEHIGQAYMAAAYPKPAPCVAPELATMEPEVVYYPTTMAPHMLRIYHATIHGRRYAFQAEFFLKRGSMTEFRFCCIHVLDLDTPSLSRKYPLRVYASSKHTGSLHISPFYTRQDLPILRTLMDALYVVARRYNFNILCARFYWDYATRKQKSVRRFYKDLSPTL